VPQRPLIACVDDDVSAREALEGFKTVWAYRAPAFPSLLLRFFPTTEAGSGHSGSGQSAFAVNPSMRGIS
jgi:hypothetical protein